MVLRSHIIRSVWKSDYKFFNKTVITILKQNEHLYSTFFSGAQFCTADGIRFTTETKKKIF